MKPESYSTPLCTIHDLTWIKYEYYSNIIILAHKKCKKMQKKKVYGFHKPYTFFSILVRLTGIEPVTRSLGNCRSIQLSYRRMYTLLYRF